MTTDLYSSGSPIAVLVFVSALSFGTASLAQAAADVTTVDGPVQYKVTLNELPGAQIYEQTGARTDDGACVFTESGSGPVSGGQGRVLVIKEISFDPNTCTRDLARADYPLQAPPASVAKTLSEQGLADNKPCSEEDPETSHGESCRQASLTPGKPTIYETENPSISGENQLAAGKVYRGSIEVRVEDPVNLPVTKTRSTVSMTSRGFSTHGAHWNWLWVTGWRLKHSFWSHGNNGRVAYTDTVGTFINDTFCQLPPPPIPPLETETDHNKTYFEISTDVYWKWNYNVTKRGACAVLLHFDKTIVTP
jgi:hypothetical protein